MANLPICFRTGIIDAHIQGVSDNELIVYLEDFQPRYPTEFVLPFNVALAPTLRHNMVEILGLEPRFNGYKPFVLTFKLYFYLFVVYYLNCSFPSTMPVLLKTAQGACH